MYRLAHFSAVLLLHPAGNDGAEVGAPPAGDTPPPPPPPSPGSDIALGGIPAPELTKRESLPTTTGVIVPNPHEVTVPDPATRPIVDDSIRPLDLDYSIAHLQALWGRDVSDLSSDEKENVVKIILDLRALADAAEAKYL